jgi:hypothetical protein
MDRPWVLLGHLQPISEYSQFIKAYKNILGRVFGLRNFGSTKFGLTCSFLIMLAFVSLKIGRTILKPMHWKFTTCKYP